MESFFEYYRKEDKSIDIYTRYLRPVKTVFRSFLDGDLKNGFIRSKVLWYIEYEIAKFGIREKFWFYKEYSIKTPKINTYNIRRRLARLRKILRNGLESDNYVEDLKEIKDYVL